MKNNDMKNGFRRKGFYIYLMAGAVCVVALAAVCLNTFGQDNNGRQLEINEPSQVAENGGDKTKDDIANGGADKLAQVTQIPKAENGITGAGQSGTVAKVEKDKGKDSKVNKDAKDKDIKDKDAKDKDARTDEKNKAKADKESSAEQQEMAVMGSGNNVSNLKFDQESGLKWPVKGEVLLNYSGESSVYFKTLKQYKCNPALIISANEGAKVCSAADAVVTKVGKNDEIGNYVVTAIGDDYKIIYGQLDNVQVKKGSEIEAGELIGSIASPSKYYIEEGSNLYMKMKCAGENVDPMIFLE